MRIYVVNGRKALKFIKLISVILLLAIGICTISDILERKFISASSEANVGKVIIIDAGHGGEDSGAIGVTGVLEKDLNLSIALQLCEALKQKGYTVILTRTEDKMLYLPEENIKGMRKISDLKNRCKLTENFKDCILISIHMNSYGSSKYSGLQVYYQEDNDESKLLASKIQNSVRESLQQENNRQIKSGRSLYLLENTKCPSVIVECGFLSNENECKKLSEKEYQKELSFSIIYGIIEYINQKTEA